MTGFVLNMVMDTSNTDVTIFIIQITGIIIAGLVFLYKWRQARRYKSRYKHLGFRWLFWYDAIEIFGTSSPSRRIFMQNQNQLSTLMWVCIGVTILLTILPI